MVVGGCFSCRLAVAVTEGETRESSDTNRRMAAFMFPSSNLEATNLASEGELRFLLISGVAEIEDVTAEPVDGVIRLRIKETRFCFLPDLIGTAKMTFAQFNKACQLQLDFGCDTISLGMPDR